MELAQDHHKFARSACVIVKLCPFPYHAEHAARRLSPSSNSIVLLVDLEFYAAGNMKGTRSSETGEIHYIGDLRPHQIVWHQ
jgi:hypothetical protein